MFKKFVTKLPSVPTLSNPLGINKNNDIKTTSNNTNEFNMERLSISSASAATAATAAASSMMGFMKKASSAASEIVKEGSAKAVELKKKAMEVADMDALQRKITHVLDGSISDDESTNLNLLYINDNIISMGFPGNASSSQGSKKYNIIDDVATFLNENHPEHYMIYNLSEESYEYNKFNDQVIEFKFPGYPAPPLGLLFKICTSIESWVTADPKNIAVIHCLTGKGRTTTVISCFLAWNGLVDCPTDGLRFVTEKKNTSIEKLTIPSQRRYIQYFENMMEGIKPRSSPLLLRRIIINTIPIFGTKNINSNHENESEKNSATEGVSKTSNDDISLGCCPYLQIFKNGKLVFTTTWKDVDDEKNVQWTDSNDGSIAFNLDCMLQGDILIRCRHLAESGERISMFRAAFHTGYIPMGILRLTKAQLDGACSDNRFHDDFFIDLIFAPIQSEDGLSYEDAQKEQQNHISIDEDDDDIKPAMSSSRNPNRNSNECIVISNEEKEAYVHMLERDEKFWQDIETRKQKRQIKKFEQSKNDTILSTTTETNPADNNASKEDINDSAPVISATRKPAFSIIEETNNINKIKITPRKSSWDEAQDIELMAQLESITDHKNPRSSLSPISSVTNVLEKDIMINQSPPAPIPLNPSISKINDPSTLHVSPALPKDVNLVMNTTTITTTNESNEKSSSKDILGEIDGLDDLDLASIGISTTTSSTVTSNNKNNEFDLSDLSSITTNHSTIHENKDSTIPSTNSKANDSLDFDELEQYLSTLSAKQ